MIIHLRKDISTWIYFTEVFIKLHGRIFMSIVVFIFNFN